MPNDNTHTLLPCPFCGSSEVEELGNPKYGAVFCNECGVSVNTVETWNTRTPAEPKAGDWEKEVEIHTAVEIHDRFQDDGIGDTEYVRLDEARALSSAAPRITEREWISVDERLPEYRKLVQVHGGIAWLDYDGEWYSATSAPNFMLADCIALGSIRIRWDVTHWMPLMTPPPFTPTQTEE